MENSYIDLVIRLKNGYLAKKEVISSPYSRFREEILKVLKKNGFIKDYQVSIQPKKILTIELLYDQGQPVLNEVKIISKLGQRIYISYKKLKPVLGGLGHSILSTSKGVLTDRQAKKQQLGGELLFQIW